jgi:hypothetical protein
MIKKSAFTIQFLLFFACCFFCSPCPALWAGQGVQKKSKKRGKSKKFFFVFKVIFKNFEK